MHRRLGAVRLAVVGERRLAEDVSLDDAAAGEDVLRAVVAFDVDGDVDVSRRGAAQRRPVDGDPGDVAPEDEVDRLADGRLPAPVAAHDQRRGRQVIGAAGRTLEPRDVDARELHHAPPVAEVSRDSKSGSDRDDDADDDFYDNTDDDTDSDIDGDGLHITYVYGEGDDANIGTFASPVKSLQVAINLAKARGDDIYAAVGTYDLKSVIFADGVDIYGGYSANFADLTVNGKTERQSEVDEKNFYRKEVRYGSFHRSVRLPVAVLGGKAEAKSENGMLKITIPKAPEAKSKAIKVKVVKGKK